MGLFCRCQLDALRNRRMSQDEEGRWDLLDQETAERVILDLGVLLGQVVQTAAPQTVCLEGQARWIGIANLVSVGQDIAVPASAIGVLARRAEDCPPQADRYPRGL